MVYDAKQKKSWNISNKLKIQTKTTISITNVKWYTFCEIYAEKCKNRKTPHILT